MAPSPEPHRPDEAVQRIAEHQSGLQWVHHPRGPEELTRARVGVCWLITVTVTVIVIHPPVAVPPRSA